MKLYLLKVYQFHRFIHEIYLSSKLDKRLIDLFMILTPKNITLQSLTKVYLCYLFETIEQWANSYYSIVILVK